MLQAIRLMYNEWLFDIVTLRQHNLHKARGEVSCTNED